MNIKQKSIKQKFIDSLEEGYKKYLTIHPRSSQKVLPMHKCISEILKDSLGGEYEIKSLGMGDNKEYNFSGRYYKKDVDIAVLKDGKPISALSFKFVTSNYKQNSNNYFENMIGETANIKRNDLIYAQILILKQKMPYFSTDKNMYTKMEKINEENLKKYFKLNKDNAPNLYHKPDIMFIAFINTGDEKRYEEAIKNKEIIKKSIFSKKELLPLVHVEMLDAKDLDGKLSEDMKTFLIKNGNFENFIEAFVNLTKGKTYGR
ncbi:MAG TPA: hypothetical protein PLM63_04215 [bacterium]|nr:hypothetical protein [bacterium]